MIKIKTGPGDTFLSNQKKRILIVMLGFFLLYLVAWITDPYSSYWTDYFTRPLPLLLSDWGMSFLFFLVVSEGSILISNRLNRRWPWTENAAKRLLIETTLNILIILLVNVIIYYMVDLLGIYNEECKKGEFTIEKAQETYHWLFVTFVMAFMIICIHTGNFLIVNWKNAAIRATELNQVAMEAELQSLKLQIDPHFVFNNLSVLSELILKDQHIGYEYAENFSKIYRYMLVNSKKNIIPLEEEMKFLQSYIYLIQQRVGEGVIFKIDVNQESRELYVPPLTLQLLTENALKHNKTYRKEPLEIKIYNKGADQLVIENTLLPREHVIDSSGVGLQNILRRYKLLSDRAPEVVKTETAFIVTIPLLKA